MNSFAIRRNAGQAADELEAIGKEETEDEKKRTGLNGKKENIIMSQGGMEGNNKRRRRREYGMRIHAIASLTFVVDVVVVALVFPSFPPILPELTVLLLFLFCCHPTKA